MLSIFECLLCNTDLFYLRWGAGWGNSDQSFLLNVTLFFPGEKKNVTTKGERMEKGNEFTLRLNTFQANSWLISSSFFFF